MFINIQISSFVDIGVSFESRLMLGFFWGVFVWFFVVVVCLFLLSLPMHKPNNIVNI